MVLTGIDPKTYTKRDIPEPTPGPSGLAKKRKTIPDRQITSQGNITYNVSTKNKYDVLSDSDDSDMEFQTNKEIQITPRKNDNASRRTRPPPLVLYNYIKDHKKTIEEINKHLTDEVTVKCRGNRLIFYSANIEDYNKLKNMILSEKLEFHTYTPHQEQDHKFVIKNLPPSISEQEIKEDLVSKNIKVKKITQMVKKLSDNTLKPLPLHIITIDNVNTIKDITSIKKVCYCVVEWEKFKNSSSITQCYKCQQFGHISKNCYKSPKCLKCAGPHYIKDCDAAVSSAAKCANCNEVHLANDKECSYYKKQILLKNKNQNPNLDQNTDPTKTSFTLRNKEFPALKSIYKVTGQNSDIPTTTNCWNGQGRDSGNNTGHNGISDIFEIFKSLYNTLNIKNIVRTLKSTAIKITSAPDNISKLGILIEAVIELFN